MTPRAARSSSDPLGARPCAAAGAPRPGPRARRGAAAIALVCAALAALSSCRRGDTDAAPEPAETEAEAPEKAPAAQPDPRFFHTAAPASFAEIAADLGESVVHLRAERAVTRSAGAALGARDARRALGSGTVVGDGSHIVTNAKLLEQADAIEVVLPGRVLPAEIAGKDERLGIALLEVEGNDALEPAPLGTSETLEVGEWVVALGDPLGDGTAASAGVLSALGRGDALAESRPDPRSLLRVDRNVATEGAGGPLADAAGRVVGIALSPPDRRQGGALAAPISRVEEVLPALEERGEVARTWLGVFVHPVTERRAERRGMSSARGALVSDIVEGSPADRADLQPGDIIVGFDGEQVDHRSLPHRVAAADAGLPIALDIRRNGRERSVTVVAEAARE